MRLIRKRGTADYEGSVLPQGKRDTSPLGPSPDAVGGDKARRNRDNGRAPGQWTVGWRRVPVPSGTWKGGLGVGEAARQGFSRGRSPLAEDKGEDKAHRAMPTAGREPLSPAGDDSHSGPCARSPQ